MDGGLYVHPAASEFALLSRRLGAGHGVMAAEIVGTTGGAG